MNSKERKIVIINQAVNYLTIGICNEFANEFNEVDLVTGKINSQGEELDSKVNLKYIGKWKEQNGFRKMLGYSEATLHILWLLVTKYRKHEVFYISIPPMGYLLNIFLWHKFSMLIWDVYPDVFKITGMKNTHLLYKTWAYLNKISFNKAFKVFTIGNKISDLLSQYVSKDKILITPIWSMFQENNRIEKKDNIFIKKYNLQQKFLIQYSGNIGLTHNVEVLIEIAKKMEKYRSIHFQIIGRGPRKSELEERVLVEKISNCQFLSYQPEEMFLHSLSAADIGVVVLDELTSKGSIPSKSYNLMCYGIPGLYIAGEDSELKDYAKKYRHAECFSEKNINAIVDYILTLYNNNETYKTYAENALKASENYKRKNARNLLELYLIK